VVPEPLEDIIVLRQIDTIILFQCIQHFLELVLAGHVCLIVFLSISEYTIHPVDILFIPGRFYSQRGVLITDLVDNAQGLLRVLSHQAFIPSCFYFEIRWLVLDRSCVERQAVVEVFLAWAENRRADVLHMLAVLVIHLRLVLMS